MRLVKATGVYVGRDDETLWLQVRTKNRRVAMIGLPAILKGRGPLVRETFTQWAEYQLTRVPKRRPDKFAGMGELD
jgi:hypothetical protein